MGLDAYSICPCMMGKKVKFCCGKSVIGDLDKILKQIEIEQFEAAIEWIDRTIAKTGKLPCLMVTKTNCLLEVDREEEAVAANEDFLSDSPTHPMGLQQKAILLAMRGSFEKGVEALQDAIDQIKGTEIPSSFAQTYIVFGQFFFNQNESFAALQHLRFARVLCNEELRASSEQLIKRMESATFPLLRQPFYPQMNIGDVEWERLYMNSLRAIARGQFRKALQYLERIDSEFPDQPPVVEGLAITNMMLGRTDTQDAWRRYAELPSLNMAQKSEALALSIMTSIDWEYLEDVFNYAFEIRNFELLTEALLSSNRLSHNLADQVQESDGVPPRFVFSLFDRPFSVEEELTEEYMPAQNLTLFWIFGRQTDQEARLEFSCMGCDQEAIVAYLNEIAPGALAEEPTIKPHGTNFPDLQVFREFGVTKAMVETGKHRDVLERCSYELLASEWVKRPVGHQDVTIEEAITREDLHPFVYARIAILECMIDKFFPFGSFDRICDTIGMPRIERVDQKQHRALASSFFLGLVDLTALSVEELSSVLKRDAAGADGVRMTSFALELLSRDDRNKQEDAGHWLLAARGSHESDDTWKYLDQALESAEPGTEQEAVVRVDRLRAGLNTGKGDIAADELQKLRPFMEIPYVKYVVTSILTSIGALDPGQPIEQQIPKTEVEPESSIILDGGAAAPATESKLWLPD